MNVDTQALTVNSTVNQQAPCEGPKAVAIPLRFDLGATQSVDFRHNELLRRFSTLQGIYIDNKDSDEPVNVIFGVTNQRVTCPANSQGYAPVLCGDPISMVFSSAGTIPINVQLLNFPVAPGFWSIAP